jgi:hypothetical protein
VSWASVKPPLKSLKGSTKPGQLQLQISVHAMGQTA